MKHLTVTFRDKQPIKGAPVIRETTRGFFIQSPVVKGLSGDRVIEHQNNSPATEFIPYRGQHIVSVEVHN